MYRRAFSGLGRDNWMLAGVGLVNRSGTMVVPFLMLYLTTRRGMSAEAAAGVLATYGVGAGVGIAAGGLATDRVGPWTTQLASLLASAAVCALLARAHSPAAIYALVFALSVAAEAFRPANAAAVAATCGPDLRAKAMSLNRMADNLGMSVGPAVGGFLVGAGYELLFYVDAATCAAAGVALAVARPRGPARAPAADEPARAGSPWRDLGFVLALPLVAVVGLVFFQMQSTYPIHLSRAYALSAEQIGLVLAGSTALIVAVEMLLVERVRALAPLRVVAVGAVLVGAGFGLLPLGTGFGFALATMAVWTTGEMLFIPVMATFAANRAGDGNRGRYMAAFTLAFAGAYVVAPIVGTRVYEGVGPAALWHGCAVAGAAAAVGFVALDAALRRAPALGWGHERVGTHQHRRDGRLPTR